MYHITNNIKVRKTISNGKSCYQVLKNKSVVYQKVIIEGTIHNSEITARKDSIKTAKYFALKEEFDFLDYEEKEKIINKLMNNQKEIAKILKK